MSMRPDQHITHPMTYTMTDPQMKTIDMTMDKTRVQNCDVRAVSHSCDVLLIPRHIVIVAAQNHHKMTNAAQGNLEQLMQFK